jgi:hypothetical protein
MATKHRFARVGRLAGACAVVGALLAGPLAAAGNATPDLGSYAGQGTGFALRVVVDLSGLPAAAKSAIQQAYAPVAAASGGKLPAQFPFVIDQRFIETLSQLGSASQAHALLGQGVIQDVVGKVTSTNFNQSADATKMGQSSSVTTATKNLPADNLPLVSATVGRLNAAISSVPSVTSDGSLASVTASLQALFSAIPGLPSELTDAMNQLQSQINGVIATANQAQGALGSALSTVGNTLASTPVGSTLGGVLDQAGLGNAIGNPSQMVTQLQNLVQIPNVTNLLNSAAATVNGLANTASATKSNGKAFSDATSKLASINVLGLLNVGAVNLASHSEAAGKPGTAHNTSSCSLASVNLGTGQGVSLDGKSLIVNGVAVPVPSVDLSAVQSAVNSVLNVAGLSVGLCDTANGKAAADGTSASQTVSALRVQFAPTLAAVEGGPITSQNDSLGLLGSTPVKIIIDPSVETAASATQAAALPASNPALPHTGAAPLATVVTGLIVTGGALILRRRFA